MSAKAQGVPIPYAYTPNVILGFHRIDGQDFSESDIVTACFRPTKCSLKGPSLALRGKCTEHTADGFRSGLIAIS